MKQVRRKVRNCWQRGSPQCGRELRGARGDWGSPGAGIKNRDLQSSLEVLLATGEPRWEKQRSSRWLRFESLDLRGTFLRRSDMGNRPKIAS